MKKKKTIKLKKCPECKGTKICSACNGSGTKRIINGRSKGSTCERQIAKMISEWTGVHFTGVPLSGGWNKTGDITPKNPKHMVRFPFNIEIKNQECFSVSMFFKGKDEFPKVVQSFWNQCFSDSRKSKKIPLLFVTKANEQIFVVMQTKEYFKYKLQNDIKLCLRRNKFRIFLLDDLLGVPFERFGSFKK